MGGIEDQAEAQRTHRPVYLPNLSLQTVGIWFAFSLILTQMHSFNGGEWARVLKNFETSVEDSGAMDVLVVKDPTKSSPVEMVAVQDEKTSLRDRRLEVKEATQESKNDSFPRAIDLAK